MAKKKAATQQAQTRWIVFIVALFLAIIGIIYVIVSGVLGTFNPLQWDKKIDQTDKKNEQPDKPAPSEVVSGDQFILEAGTENGVSLYSGRITRAKYAEYGVTATAIGAHTVTAVVSPANADYKTVDWYITGPNGSDASEFVTVTPAADGSTTATVTCLKEFNKEFTLKCVSRNNEQAYGTIKVNYVQKLLYTAASTGEVSFTGNNENVVTWNFGEIPREIVGDNSTTTKYVDHFSETYSKTDNVLSRSVSVSVSNSLKAKIATAQWNSYDANYYDKTVSYDDIPSCIELFYDEGHEATGYKMGVFNCASGANDYDVDIVNANDLTQLYALFKQCTVDLIVTINTELQYGGTVSKTYNVNIAFPVGSVNVDGEDINF